MLSSFVNQMYDKKYSRNSVAKPISIIKMLFKDATEPPSSYIAINPAINLKKRKEKNTVTTV
jgi:hypothetical protein